jgi:hypothetical protein
MRAGLRGTVAIGALSGFVAACASSGDLARAPDIHPINYAEAELIGDSLGPFNDLRYQGFELLTAKKPSLWGRYICRPRGGNLNAAEFEAFRRNTVRPILILQPGQHNMNKGVRAGRAAASCFENSVNALRAANGADLLPLDNLMIFLDVEKGTDISSDYLVGLIDDLQADGFLSGASTFGIYMNANDGLVLAPAINGAIRDKLPITTVWYAAYLPYKDVMCVSLPYWERHNALSSGKIDVTAEVWQYAENCHAYGTPYEHAGFDISFKGASLVISDE